MDLWIIDVPLWVLIGSAVLIALGLWWLSRDSAFDEQLPSDEEAARLAIPYYIERDGLSNLAANFKIEVPRTREVTRHRKWIARVRGIGGGTRPQ